MIRNLLTGMLLLAVTPVASADHLYSEEGQELAEKNFFRPRDAKIPARNEATFGKLDLFTVDEVFGGWKQAQAAHFRDGGLFDRIYQVK
jgi:ABC-type sulfate transport system substrate-binding protein